MELTATGAVWRAETQDERLRLAFVQFSNLCREHKVSALAHGRVAKKSTSMSNLGNRGQIFSMSFGRTCDLRTCCVDLRKHLYPMGKKNYPSMLQKHFNGAETGLRSLSASIL